MTKRLTTQRNLTITNCKGLKLAIFGTIIFLANIPQKIHANPFYEAGCRRGVNDHYPGRFEAEAIKAYCKCQSRNRGKSNEHCAAILTKESGVQSFSNAEEYTIGAISITICAKRLGLESDEKAHNSLLQTLSEQNIPISFGSRQDLWEEAHRDVGEGTDWCMKQPFNLYRTMFQTKGFNLSFVRSFQQNKGES